MRLIILTSALIAGALTAVAGAFTAIVPLEFKAADLTVCWAAWNSADTLMELSSDFGQQAGYKMKFEFLLWPIFAAPMLNGSNSGEELCVLMIGDSQWNGGGGASFYKDGTKMGDFAPVVGYAEFPKYIPNYWVIFSLVDVVGKAYRKDWPSWLSRPELQSQTYGLNIAVPKTFADQKNLVDSFQKCNIDGKTVHGAAIYTEQGPNDSTTGAIDVVYGFGFQHSDSSKAFDVEGFLNSAQSMRGLEFRKVLWICCTSSAHANAT